jgi:lipid-A-disaccharide synthase-like uncharacterized protein
MDKKNLPLSLLFVAIYAVAYFYLKHSELWVRYRWTGLAFGAAWAVTYLLLRKDDRTYDLGLRFAIFFCLAGVIVLVDFLKRGDSSEGFLASMFLGFGAQALYAHYKARKLTMENKTPAP